MSWSQRGLLRGLVMIGPIIKPTRWRKIDRVADSAMDLEYGIYSGSSPDIPRDLTLEAEVGCLTLEPDISVTENREG